MHVQPYLFFDGRCDEALDFYAGALGAEVSELMRWKDCPEPDAFARDNAEKVMHASVRIGETVVLVSDGRCQGAPDFRGFALTVTVADAAEAERRFAALAEGGAVQMPLAETFFAMRFGMIADRFGVTWMIMAET